jgi:predicted Zn-dependent peptidase
MSARTTPEQITSALSALGLELALLGGPTYFDEGDVEAAKKALRVAGAIARESGPSAAHTLAAYWAVGGLDYYRGYEDGLQAVTVEDVRAYVDRYLAGQPRVIAVIATEELMAPLTAVFGQYVAAWPRFGG